MKALHQLSVVAPMNGERNSDLCGHVHRRARNRIRIVEPADARLRPNAPRCQCCNMVIAQVRSVALGACYICRNVDFGQ